MSSFSKSAVYSVVLSSSLIFVTQLIATEFCVSSVGISLSVLDVKS